VIQHPTLEEVLLLHQQLIKHFGGHGGVRDPGLLESALFRPQTGYYKDIIQMAAALMESLAINHPFIDGNKRVCFFLTDIFLRTNGWKTETRPQVGHQFICQVIVGAESRFLKIERWLRKHVVPHQQLNPSE
jgi:death on curing protein